MKSKKRWDVPETTSSRNDKRHKQQDWWQEQEREEVLALLDVLYYKYLSKNNKLSKISLKYSFLLI